MTDTSHLLPFTPPHARWIFFFFSLFIHSFTHSSLLHWMSVCRSTRIKAGQLGIGPESTASDLHEAPTTAKHQQTGRTPKGNAQHAGQGTGEDPAAGIVAPVEKTLKAAIQTMPENPRAKTRKPILPRSPLPQRINRVVQPAKPVMPRSKRTSAAVAAADFEGKDSELLAEPEDDVLEDFPMDEDESCDSQDGNDEPIRLDDQCSEIEPESVTVSWTLPRPSVQF
jgi:hypothetical protein